MSVAALIVRRPEPTKERVERTTLGITAIELPHLNRFTLLLLLRIQRWAYMCVIMSPLYFPISQDQDDLQQWIVATDMLAPICCSHDAASP